MICSLNSVFANGSAFHEGWNCFSGGSYEIFPLSRSSRDSGEGGSGNRRRVEFQNSIYEREGSRVAKRLEIILRFVKGGSSQHVYPRQPLERSRCAQRFSRPGEMCFSRVRAKSLHDNDFVQRRSLAARLFGKSWKRQSRFLNPRCTL